MRELIVVACHGHDWVGQCRMSLELYAPRADVLYVQTIGRWPTGAFLDTVAESYHAKDADRFLLMQDSMTALADPLPWFRDQWPGSGAVAWQRFPMQWDSNEQRRTVQRRYTSWPTHGIFGPIFYTDRASLDALDKLGLLPEIPHDRLTANASERAWAYAFEQAGMPVVGPEWRPDLLTAGEPFGPFRKVLANRNPLT